MFSKTCEYAIRAIIYIAQQTQDGSRVGVKAIAKGIASPEYFIAKILQDLSRKDFVQSVKGPNGGFYLSEDNLNTPLAKLVREIDGDKLFTSCALGLKQCSEQHPCPLHHEFKLVKEGYVRILEESLIADLVGGVDSELTFLKV
ncbi:MAG: Rrf2 family transcriptional regulator [Weeksellaceae bacterium]